MCFFLKYLVTLFYKKLRIKIVVSFFRESGPWARHTFLFAIVYIKFIFYLKIINIYKKYSFNHIPLFFLGCTRQIGQIHEFNYRFYNTIATWRQCRCYPMYLSTLSFRMCFDSLKCFQGQAANARRQSAATEATAFNSGTPSFVTVI